MSSEANTGRVINLPQGGGVRSFNGRRGAVMPQAGDYTAQQVGARPDTWMPTADDVGARPSTWTPTAAEVGARPITWTPTAADVGARPSTWTPTADDVGAKASGWVPFAAGTSAPADKTQLWIDTTAGTGGLKYWNGSAWVAVPVAYT